MRHPTLLTFAVLAACAGEDAPTQGNERPDGARRLTFPVGNESNQNACFSPDGTFLVFTQFENGYNVGPGHLFRLDLAPGSEPLQLTAGDYDDVNVPYGCFDQSNGRVIFASDREEANDFWTINPDPSAPDLQRLTHHGELPVWIEPVFSPDAAWVAFEADMVDAPTEEAERAAIFKVDVATKTPVKLTNASGTLDDRLPSWSPDGTSILYQHRDPSLPESLDTWEAWVMGTDGYGAVNISALADVAEPGPDTDLSWTPNARFILSSTNPSGTEHPSIYMLPVAGGQMIRVTQAADFEDGAACAAPDGLSIAFESHRQADEDSPSDLWVIATPTAALP